MHLRRDFFESRSTSIDPMERSARLPVVVDRKSHIMASTQVGVPVFVCKPPGNSAAQGLSSR